MNFNSDLELLDDFTRFRNLKDISKKSYKTTMNLYSSFNNESFVNLLIEAEMEELNQIRWKNRKLKQRLLNFRNFLVQNYMKNYSQITLNRVITIYRHYDIEVHNLPAQSSKNYKESAPVTYNDLPDRKTIKRALRISTPVMKATTLFMLSSGCARRETLNLTIGDFIKATGDYHTKEEINEVIKVLKRKKVVPTFKLKRQKTNKYYYTFCSPEAVKEIIRYLNTRSDLDTSDKLFDIHPESLSRCFIKINNQLKLGKCGTYNRYRSHVLRELHASNLKNSGMLIEDINSLQGKRRNITDESYFFENPEVLKEKYIKHLNAVTVYDKNMVKEVKKDNLKVVSYLT